MDGRWQIQLMPLWMGTCLESRDGGDDKLTGIKKVRWGAPD